MLGRASEKTMANVTRFWILRHLRAEPNQFILHYKGGKVVRSGAGIAYWFNPLSAAVAQVPVEDNETTFVLNERSSDFQEVSVQCTVVFRVADHGRAASRVNFAISLETGAWLERPIERLASLWSQKSLEPVRSYISSVPVVDAVRLGAEKIRASLDELLRKDAEIAAIGLELVTVQITRVAPTAELEKALQTPTRESLQQKADEAMFSRRALAVEKERAIKENELATEVELARRQAQLIEQKGANQRLDIQQAAANERTRIEAEVERLALVARAETERLQIVETAAGERNRLNAENYARDILRRGVGDTESRKLWDNAEVLKEAARIALWKDTPQRVAAAFAMQTAASKLDKVNHLNITPDMLRGVLDEIVAERGQK
jgi:regulator of protease activity HflC (stomatin/prohibitin superfamily)